MKKNYLNKMLMVFAMIFAVGMFAACSSDDDNSKTETPSDPKVPTSGTLYMYEVVLPEATNWADCGFSWTKSGTTVTKITTSANATTLDKLTNAKLVDAIKKTIKYVDGLKTPESKALADKAVVIVDSVNIKESFASYVNFSFVLKSGFEDKGEKQNITYGMSLCFIDNLGNINYGDKTYGNGFADVNNPTEFLKVLENDEKSWSVSVTKGTTRFSLVTK